MPDPLTDQLIQRQLQDPQAAWQHASSIGSDVPQTKDFTFSMMPGLPGNGLLKRLAELFASPQPTPPSNFSTLGEQLPEFTPKGGEEVLNQLRGGGNSLMEKVYQNILQKGGR